MAQLALASIPAYIMQTTTIPFSICDRIDKICRDFIWNDSENRNKIHLVSWESICKSKNVSGLGFRKARVLNNANLMKLAWKLIHNRDALWVQVMRSKYKCGDSLIPQVQKSRRMSNVWKGISQVWPKFKRNLVWRVGNGQSILFWQDHWIPGIDTLADFATVDLLNEMNDETAAEYVGMDGDWNYPKLSQVLDNDCLQIFPSLKPPDNGLGEDNIAWLLNNDGVFSIRTTCEIFSNHVNPNNDRTFK